jgi:hypothetical protein
MKRLDYYNDLGIYFNRTKLFVFFKVVGYKLKFNMFNKFYMFYKNNKIVLKYCLKNYFKRFMFIIKFLFKNIFYGFYVQIQIKGLGFRVRNLRRIKAYRHYKITMNYSSFTFIFDSKYNVIKRRDKQYLTIFSPFLRDLKDIMAYILLFRVIRPYKRKRGAYYRKLIYIMKPGKKLKSKKR